MGCGCNKTKCTNVCRKEKIRWCGSNLSCSGINRGDDFNTIITKIDTSLCSDQNQYEYINTFLWSSGDYVLSDTSHGSWNKLKGINVPVFGNTPTLIIPKDGKYKITYDLQCYPEDTVAKVVIGIGVNNSQPISSGTVNENGSLNTRMIDISNGNDTHNTFFIADLLEGDIIDLWVKVSFELINFDGYHRVMLEKIA